MSESQLFTVELDFQAMHQVEVVADSAAAAYKKAKDLLESDALVGETELRRIDSFQVFDEKMVPQDIGE